MTSSITRKRNLNRLHRRPEGESSNHNSQDNIFEGPWEELVIRFDKELGDFTVRTTSEAKTAELHDSARHRLG
jgi:hypothetical protein